MEEDAKLGIVLQTPACSKRYIFLRFNGFNISFNKVLVVMIPIDVCFMNVYLNLNGVLEIYYK